MNIEGSSGAQYLQLGGVQGVASGSPHDSVASSPDSPRSVAFLSTMPPSEQHMDGGPQLTQLTSHISYTGGVDSPPSGNMSRWARGIYFWVAARIGGAYAGGRLERRRAAEKGGGELFRSS